MSFLHLFIVNKSGGLIHHRPLSSKAASTSSGTSKIGTNEWLRIASTFHSLYAIAAEASPIRLFNNKNYAGGDDGIEEIRASGMILQCYQTVTGIKFVITVAISDNLNVNDILLSNTLRDVLKEIYTLYTECVLKDPFYELEMPIRSELFVQGVDILIQQKYQILLNKIITTSSTSSGNNTMSTNTPGAILSGSQHSTIPSSSSKLMY